MTESRFANFNTCCRLCLNEKAESLKPLFDSAVDDRSLPQKILAFVAIEISASDKLSTFICDKCISRVNAWQSYKQECTENQTKLQQWMTTWTGNEMAEMSFQIKEEPMVTDEDIPEIVNLDDEDVVPVKIEHAEGADDSTVEDFEIPPALTPHLPEMAVESEDSQNSTPSSFDSRKCRTCNKLFSNAGNRKKHEKQIHNINQSSFGGDILAVQDESQTSVDSSIGPEKSSDTNESDHQKIVFAAGLKLLQKDSTPIEFEALSKIELSYIEKCKAMVTMFDTLVCACHQVSHPNLKGMLSHLRALRIWFPVFTCYNCMITFTDRSSFSKHHVRCPKGPLETITVLSNLRKRSQVKTRLYQNYKCTICKFMYSFHDEFCKHVDEEHVSGNPPYRCACNRTFDNVEDYKDHIYVSCLVQYYCDICFITTASLDAFQKHASEVHDNSEGFVLLQDDGYKVRRSFQRSSPPDDPPEIVTGKRRSSFYNKKVVESDDETTPTRIDHKLFSPEVANRKGPQKCPLCSKEYSNYANMLRHYRTHQEVTNPESNTTDKEEPQKDTSFYSCPDCGGVYDSQQWLKHLAEKHEQKNCGECGKNFQFQSELDQHRSVHLNLKVYRDSKTQSYKSTMLSPNTENGSEIDECAMEDNELDSNVSAPLANVKKEASDGEASTARKFECKICDKTYSGYGGLWDHNKKKHPEIKTPQSKDFPKQCKYCDKLFYTGGSYFMHKQMHERALNPAAFNKPKRGQANNEDDESYHTCKRCFKVFSSRYNLKNHMKSHGINLSPSSKAGKSSKKAWCDVCHIACDNNAALAAHKQQEHGEDEMPDLSSDASQDSKTPYIFTCDTCVMTFTTKIALKKHKEKHVQEDIKPLMIPKQSIVYCKYCKVAFGSVTHLNKHMEIEHAEQPPQITEEVKVKNEVKAFKCNICKKAFSSSAALCAHQGWHKRTNFEPKNDKAPKLLKEHKVTPKKPAGSIVVKSEFITKPEFISKSEFQCDSCSLDFPNDTALQIHILEKHREINAIMLTPRCNICAKDFQTNEEYETHKRLHDLLERQKQQQQQMQGNMSPMQSKQMLLKQQIQQKQLLQKQPTVLQVQQPKVITKNFPCNYCPAAFSRADTLNAHLRQNHKEYVPPEYKCTHCDRVFDKQNSLSIHLKVHEKQQRVNVAKPLFSCSICNMGFDLPKDLRAHTINQHPF